MKNRYSVGNVFQTNNYGNIEIIERVDTKTVIIKFSNTGNTQKTSTTQILRGEVRDNPAGKLICGWGINDVDYETQKYIELSKLVNKKKKVIWKCPYYIKWSNMVNRCYNPKYHDRQPAYKGCTICEEWKYLSNFIKWVDSQPNRDWENCDLDKDLLLTDNKYYSPETCVFVDRLINSFITNTRTKRGEWSIGVKLDNCGKFQAQCSSPFAKKLEHIGLFLCPNEAHKAWQAKKHEHACILAEQQQDPRVAKALRERYAPDKDWSNM